MFNIETNKGIKMKNDNNEFEITVEEQKMVNDFIKFLNNDMKELLLINLAKYIFGQNKLAAKNILENWVTLTVINQKENINKIYDKLNDEQKQKVINKDRYMEIFDFCVNDVKNNWINILNLNNFIITN